MINTTSERLKARNFATFKCIHVQEVFHVYLNKFEIALFYFIIFIDLHRLVRFLGVRSHQGNSSYLNSLVSISL